METNQESTEQEEESEESELSEEQLDQNLESDPEAENTMEMSEIQNQNY